MNRKEYKELEKDYKYANWVLLGCIIVAVIINYYFISFLVEK